MSETVATPRVYQVPEENLDVLLARLDKASKRSMRLIGKPITVTLLGESQRRRGGRMQTVVDVTLDFEVPKLAGWTFVAVLDHRASEIGNVVRMVPNTVSDIPKRFRSAAANCDHCHHRVQRRDTFVLRHDDGSFKQVGRQCIRDFLGHDPGRLVQMAELVASVREALTGDCEDYDFAMKDRRFIPVRRYLDHVAAMIREHGWVSRKDAQNAPEDQGLSPTSGRALDNMYPHSHSDRRFVVVPSEADQAVAQVAFDWAVGLQDKPSLSNFEHNIMTIATAGRTDWKNTGLAAAIIVAYQRVQQQQVRRRTAAQDLRNSQHLGQEGARLRELRCTVLSSFVRPNPDGAFLPTTIVKMVTEDGNVLVWFAKTEVTVAAGDTVLVDGTVIRHDSYQGIKQTILNRCRIALDRPATGA